jgi:hypothetical protein
MKTKTRPPISPIFIRSIFRHHVTQVTQVRRVSNPNQRQKPRPSSHRASHRASHRRPTNASQFKEASPSKTSRKRRRSNPAGARHRKLKSNPADARHRKLKSFLTPFPPEVTIWSRSRRPTTPRSRSGVLFYCLPFPAKSFQMISPRI